MKISERSSNGTGSHSMFSARYSMLRTYLCVVFFQVAIFSAHAGSKSEADWRSFFYPSIDGNGQSILSPEHQVSSSREYELMETLLVYTNALFDQNLCRAIGLSVKDTGLVSYLHISLTFFYPKEEDSWPSQAEMVLPDNIVYDRGKIQRQAREAGDFEIPADYVRVFNPARKRIRAELDVLVAVSSGEKAKTRRIERRVFRYEYTNHWKQIGKP